MHFYVMIASRAAVLLAVFIFYKIRLRFINTSKEKLLTFAAVAVVVIYLIVLIVIFYLGITYDQAMLMLQEVTNV